MITIIVLLLALLMPAMDKAIDRAERVICLANQRHIVQGCQLYAMDNKRLMPLYAIPDSLHQGGAYDLRSWRGFVDLVPDSSPEPRVPLGFGLLPAGGYLPTTQLAKVMHCPTFNNEGDPSFPKFGMDRITSLTVGASWWVDPQRQGWRVMVGYNYRRTSYGYAGKGNLKLDTAQSGFVVSVDMPDVRFAGRGLRYSHVDGYHRAFGDGAASFLADPDHEVENKILTEVNTSGAFYGGSDAGRTRAVNEEKVWDYLAYEGR